MSRTLKLSLDVLLGAVVPILILAYGTDALGSIPAYLLSALIPVGWVFVDLFFVTRRFNFITTFLGLNAIVRGLLAFWFVDGLLYAIKDTAGGLLTVAIFGGSILVGRPVVRAFATQSLDPRSPEQESALGRLFGERRVARALLLSTALLAGVNVVTSIINFVLNLRIVVAPFGTEAFNVQVAQVNAITRLAIGVPEFLTWGLGLWLVFHALYAALYAGLPERVQSENHDFWDLVTMRERRASAPAL